MDKKKLFNICASSNLLEANSCWSKLKENYDLSFDSYGEFTMSLMKNMNSGIILVIFLEDLIADSEDNIILLKDRYALFFQELENRASSSVKPIVLCWGKNNNQNIISSSKRDSTLEEFYKWFSEKLSILKKRFETIYLIDLNEIFYPFGSNEMFSDRNWYFAHCRLSIQGLKVLTDALLVLTSRLFSAPSKVLVLDCDNTLWGGVVGENGWQGIRLGGRDHVGEAFKDFQLALKALSNKGIQLAKGDVIGFLNSDDFYNNDKIIFKVANLFKQDPLLDCCYADLIYTSKLDKTKNVRYWKSSNFSPGLFSKGWCPPHQTFFVRRSVYEKFGSFNLDYHIASDVELMMRFLEVHKINFRYVPEVWVKMRLGGTTNKNLKNIYKQNIEVLNALKFHGITANWFYFLLNKIISRLLQFLR